MVLFSKIASIAEAMDDEDNNPDIKTMSEALGYYNEVINLQKEFRRVGLAIDEKTHLDF